MERCQQCGALIALVGIRHRCMPREAVITADKKPAKPLKTKGKRPANKPAKDLRKAA